MNLSRICATVSENKNMKTEITLVFGQFRATVAVSADIDGAGAGAILRLAATQVLQRSPASAAEKKIAGYEKRPEKFNRREDASMSYSEERAATLAECFTGKANIQDSEDGKPEVWLEYACTDVSNQLEYAPATNKRYVQEKAAFAHVAGICENDLAAMKARFAEKISFTGEIGTLTEPSQAILLALEAHDKKLRAARLATL